MSEEPDPYALPPELEAERLRSLDQLHVLYSPPEDRFAHITRMARVAMGVPMSAINLIDRDRQWCKQFSADHELHFNVPREESVCRATIARAYREPEDPALIFEDLTDSEFASLPAIATEGGVRFYAGFPLYGPGGHPVGTFCVYDTEPRRLSTQDRATFAELAAWAQRELESTDDLQRAADVQHQLLPPPLGDLPGYTVATLFEPAFAVAGDFYDHYPVPGGLNISVADVMGKGLGPAIVAANVRSALRAASRAFDHTARSGGLAAEVSAVDEQLTDDLAATDTFVTLFHACLQTATGRLTYVDAGHGIAAVLRRSGAIDDLKGGDLPLGINIGGTWTTHELVMESGDMLVIASDGLLDLLGDKAVSADAFTFLSRHTDPSELCSAVSILAKERPPTDDVTVIAVCRGQ
ncbi:MAG: GAF domain-containing SpoIIE family protein phosphatase [Mycobacterium sp.]|mgnify:CR=1 FL=1